MWCFYVQKKKCKLKYVLLSENATFWRHVWKLSWLLVQNVTSGHFSDASNFVTQTVQTKKIHDFYWNSEQRCRKYTTIICKCPVCHQITFFATHAFSIYFLCTGNSNASIVPLAFSMSVPFSTSVYWGWYLLYCVQFSISTAYITTMVLITSYFLSCCFYINAICQHFDHLIHLADIQVEQNQREINSHKLYDFHRSVNQLWKDAIGLHELIYEWL